MNKKYLDWGITIANYVLVVFFLIIGLSLFLEWVEPVDFTVSQVFGFAIMVGSLAILQALKFPHEKKG